MAKGVYFGIGGKARKVKKMYIGIGSKARQIKKAYIGIGSKARLFYTSSPDITNMKFTFSDNSGIADSGVVTMGEKQYRLLTITKSGILIVPETVNAEVWMCSRGTSGCLGGGAGGFTVSGVVTLSGSMVSTVGSGGAISKDILNHGGASSFAGLSTPVNFSGGSFSASGGTGGGSTNNLNLYLGKGDGVAKYPFNDSSYFTKCHCAGGGAGGFSNHSYGTYNGGKGGTNGGDGDASTTISSGHPIGGSGGTYGGGNGGSASRMNNVTSGTSATYYGSGGGGSGHWYMELMGTGSSYTANNGAGYQGVIYIRIPIEQS